MGSFFNFYTLMSFGNTRVYISQTSGDVHLRFVHFTACKFCTPKKSVNKFWPLDDAYMEIFREKCIAICKYFEMCNMYVYIYGLIKEKLMDM